MNLNQLLLSVKEFRASTILREPRTNARIPQPRAGRGMMFALAALGFAMGMGTAHFFQPDSSAAPASQTVTQQASADELVAQFHRVDWNAENLQGLEALASALGHSELLRSEALKRYQLETNPRAKNNLGRLLTTNPLPEVSAVAMGWAQQRDSATTRADGFTLLAWQEPSQAIYRLTRQAIEQEQNPKALAAAIWALRYPNQVLDPAEVSSVLPRLHALTQHSAEEVQAASIQQLAQWDKNKQYIEQDVLRIVNADASDDTRTAAVGASSILGLNSDELKHAFFRLLNNPNTSPDLRGVILLQMDRFLLSTNEYKTYQKEIYNQAQPANQPNGDAK